MAGFGSSLDLVFWYPDHADVAPNYPDLDSVKKKHPAHPCYLVNIVQPYQATINEISNGPTGLGLCPHCLPLSGHD